MFRVEKRPGEIVQRMKFMFIGAHRNIIDGRRETISDDGRGGGGEVIDKPSDLSMENGYVSACFFFRNVISDDFFFQKKKKFVLLYCRFYNIVWVPGPFRRRI